MLKNAGRYFSLRGTVRTIWSPSGRSGFPICPAKCALPTKFCLVEYEVTKPGGNLRNHVVSQAVYPPR